MTAGSGSDAAIRDLGGRPGFLNAAPEALRSRLLSNQHGQQMSTGLPGGRPAPNRLATGQRRGAVRAAGRAAPPISDAYLGLIGAAGEQGSA